MVAFRTLVADKTFLLQMKELHVFVSHRVMLPETRESAERFVTAFALVFQILHVIVEMVNQLHAIVKSFSASVADEWHVDLLWNVDRLVRQLRKYLRKFSFYDSTTRAHNDFTR